MNKKFEKLKTLLKELFQLNQPDLDFGLYRIMHAKSAEVTQFLDKDLLPQVQQAFGLYKTADKAELEKELVKAIEQAQSLGADPETLPKVKELRGKIANDAVDIGGLENEVYDHLFSFFRRYYSEGDFLAKRVYRPGVYAVPYEGEEVKLHWANRDQYYIKTSEYLRDYAFRLKPDDAGKPMRVHFRLADAAEGEHGNVKAAEGKDRVFILAAEDFIAEEDGDLVLRFAYRPATLADWPESEREGKKKPPAQKDFTASAVSRILAVRDAAFTSWIAELGKPHVNLNGEKPGHSRLEGHLKRYTARNTFDYFIHKDLGGFLRRELDFYVKNEVMHLDDIESDTAPRVEQYLSKIKVIRQIASKVIDFLAQLEDFQKNLWLKKKFVVETQYCITLDRIPEELYLEIAANDAQRDEWVRLFAIDQIEGNQLGQVAYSIPLATAFLAANDKLPVDTKHFPESFRVRLLNSIPDIDSLLTGTLVHSENFQALNIISRKHSSDVDFIYIDPPYNTPHSEIAYKNQYKHSSWLSLISNTIPSAKKLLKNNGSSFGVAIDDFEHTRLSMLLDDEFPELEKSTVVVNHHPQGAGGRLSRTHEYLVIVSSSSSPSFLGRPRVEDLEEERSFMRSGRGENNFRRPANGIGRPNSFYALLLDPATNKIVDAEGAPDRDAEYPTGPNSAGLVRIYPINSAGEERVWRSSFETGRDRARRGELTVSARGTVYQSLNHDGKRETLFSNWTASEFNAGVHGTTVVSNMGLSGIFDYPKSINTMETVLWAQSFGNTTALVLDYFAGSGTTAHAVVNTNREFGTDFRFILVEMGAYFDKILMPRLLKGAYSSTWSNGKPVRRDDGATLAVRYLRLESYEDALNNLVPRRSAQQDDLLASAEAQGADRLKEQYMLRYMLDVETRGSQSLLNVKAFADPTAYKLKVKRPGSDESSEVNVDLLETFNWLIGLTVQGIAAPQTFTAEFERDAEGRLNIKGRMRQDAAGPWWFRTVTGSAPDGRRALIIWRKLTGEPEQDNLVLDTWFTRAGYSAKDSEFGLIYVNGDNNLENLKAADDTWKVRLIEEDFHRLMFDTEGL